MIFRAIAVATVLAFNATAQAQAPLRYDVAVAQVYPLPIELANEVRSATPHDALFVQPSEIRDVVRLQAPVEAVQAVGQGRLAISLAAGAELYRVALRFRPEVHAYCAAEVMLTPDPRGVPRAARACLTDDDGDSAFETAWWMDIATQGTVHEGAFHLDPVLRIGGGQVHGLFAPLFPPVRYEAISPYTLAPLSLGVEFVTASGGTAYFAAIAIEGDNTHVPIGGGWARATAAPSTIHLSGAEIEIVSIADDAVSYRVITAMPVDQGVALAPPPPPAPPPAPPPVRR